MSGDTIVVAEAKRRLMEAAVVIRQQSLTLLSHGIQVQLHSWGEEAGSDGVLRPQGNLAVGYLAVDGLATTKKGDL